MKRELNFNTPGNQLKFSRVQGILEELRKYWPLTLRQIHYQFVVKDFYANTISQYTMLSTFLSEARIREIIPYEVMEDRTRILRDYSGYLNLEDYVNKELNNFLSGYYRNLMQSQEVYLEVFIEKEALSSVFSSVCADYCVPLMVCKGFFSTSCCKDFKDRAESRGKDKRTIILYFGDFDPSGVFMPESLEYKIRDKLHVDNFEIKKIALTQEQIAGLPNNPDALKEKDPRAPRFKELYGTKTVELDALHPKVLEQMVKEAILNEITKSSAFNKEIKRHNEEANRLKLLEESGEIKDYICAKLKEKKQ